MHAGIEFFRKQLHLDSSIVWETPLALMVPQTPFAVTYGDSCLSGGGDFSTSLGFWWHLDIPN